MTDSFNSASAAVLPEIDSAPVSLAVQPPGTNRLQINSMLDYLVDGPAEFIFLIHAARGMGQSLVQEDLQIEPQTPFRTYSDAQSGNRFLRLQASAGPLKLVYRALVDRLSKPADVTAREAPVHDLPDELLHYLMPTR